MRRQGLAVGREVAATPLPRWDGRPMAFVDSREVRRLFSGFGHEVELVLFHFVPQAGAEQLLAEGFVDEIEEIQL